MCVGLLVSLQSLHLSADGPPLQGNDTTNLNVLRIIAVLYLSIRNT